MKNKQGVLHKKRTLCKVSIRSYLYNLFLIRCNTDWEELLFKKSPILFLQFFLLEDKKKKDAL